MAASVILATCKYEDDRKHLQGTQIDKLKSVSLMKQKLLKMI